MKIQNVSRFCLFAGLLLMAVTALSADAQAQSAQGTLQQRKDCADDARMVCGRFIPDVNRITQCMQANKRQLSPQCRRHFR